MRVLTAISLAVLASAALRAGEAADVPVALTTAGASRLRGLAHFERGLLLRPETPAAAPQALDVATIQSITFYRRIDPNQENRALVALGDLQSAHYDERQKAIATLRALGRAALKPLRQAARSTDAETASRALALLTELGIPPSESASDIVTLKDGSVLRGDLAANSVVIRTRWGAFRFPLASVESVEFIAAGELANAALASADAAPADVRMRESEPMAVKRWPDPNAKPAPGSRKLFAGLTTLDPERIPNPDAAQAGETPLVEAQAGAHLDDAFASWGVLLSGKPGTPIEVAEAGKKAFFGKFAMLAKNSDLNVRFMTLNTDELRRKDGFRRGGVTVIAALLPPCEPESIGLAVYDHADRQLGVVYNKGVLDVGAQVQADAPEFLGVRSDVPIVRARFFRTAKAGDPDVLLGPIALDRINPADRPADASCVGLSSGDRVCGQIVDASSEKLRMRLEFMPESAPPAELFMQDVKLLEPRFIAPAAPNPDRDEKALVLGTPHGILLQSGECFRACVLSLNDTQALFMLPGGVQLTLPRALLRKIDMAPPEDRGAPLVVKADADEKSGVVFRGSNEKPPQLPPVAPGAKKAEPDVLQNTQKLEPMYGVEIQAIDGLNGELTIKDDNGPWTIGLAMVKTLTFALDPKAQNARPKFRDWTLVLRNGSRFDISLNGITTNAIQADMAGGNVVLPFDVVDSLRR